MPENRAKRPPIPDLLRPAARLTAIASIAGTAAVLPAGYPLRQASFVRRRDHLLVRADGHPEVCVPHFFSSRGRTTLVTCDGVEMSRHMVLLMLNMSPRMERALSELAVPEGREF